MKRQAIKGKWVPSTQAVKTESEASAAQANRELDRQLREFARKIEVRYGKRQADALKWTADWQVSASKRVRRSKRTLSR